LQLFTRTVAFGCAIQERAAFRFSNQIIFYVTISISVHVIIILLNRQSSPLSDWTCNF